MKSDWEIARNIMWSNLTPYSKKGIKVQDVLSFPWDKDSNGKPKQEQLTTATDVKKIMESAKKRKEILNKML